MEYSQKNTEEEKKDEKDKSSNQYKKTFEELDDVFSEKEKEAEEKLEATLFIAGKFLNINELVSLTDINPLFLKELLFRLEKKYSSGPIRIINRDNYWKMDVAEKYHYLVNRLATGKSEFTKAEQETLAIIAHKQPIKQSVVIRIRGNKAYDHIKKFLDLGLIVSKKIGHTFEISLSENFYNYFNIGRED